MTGNGTSTPTLTQPHTLTKTDQATGADPTYSYDATGNTKTRALSGGSQSLLWNSENKVTEASGFGDGSGPVVGLSGKCLDDTSSSTADGSPIQLYSCNNSVAQQWKPTGDTLRVMGKCASANGTANGTKILLATCDGSATQKFTVRTSDQSLYNPASGKCIDVPSSNDADGTDLQLYTCNSTAAQQWTLADHTSYIYDAEGNRILQHSAAGSVLYLGDTEVSADINGNVMQSARMYGQSGAPTTVRSTRYGSATGHTLSILLNDLLGTATTSVDETAGQPYTRRSFKPYGETRGVKPSAWPNGHTYLGAGIDDTTTALTQLGAREYDPSTGRFISADPVIDMGDPLQVNGYAYSHNNPVTHSDPTGLYDPDRMEYERQRRLMNDNPGLHKPRAKPPVVVNSDLHNILAAIYIRDQAATAKGDGKVGTALIQEFNSGEAVGSKWHIAKAADLMKRLTDLLEKNRVQKMKSGTSLLSDDDLKIAHGEAKELWSALNSNDVTGNVTAYIDGDDSVRKGLEGVRKNIVSKQAVSDITGQKFEVDPRDRSPNPRPRQTGEPLHMKGFMKGFGIVGSAAGLGQYPLDVYHYGWKEGTRSTLESLLDPLDMVPDGQGVGCVFFNECYAEAGPMA